MTKTLLMATTALMLSAGAAFAAPSDTPAQEVAQSPQPTGPTNEAPLVDANQRGVLVFTPDFFTAMQPNTALDMVERVPGFRLNDGDGGRGFEGAVGNTLINGARPASKNDTGSNALFRVPANQVERIELIRGGAPGVDMQGYSLVVNVVLKSNASSEHIFQTDAVLFDGRRTDLYGARYQFTHRDGERTWGVILADGMGLDDSGGPGVAVTRDSAGAVLNQFNYFSEGYGGGTAARLNYAAPLLGGKIDLTTRYGVDDFHSLSLFENADESRVSNYDNDGDSFEFGATYTRPLGERLKSETRFIHEWGKSDEVSTFNIVDGGVAAPESRFESTAESSETILRSLLRWEKSESVTLEGGGEVAYNRLDAAQELSDGGVIIPLPSDEITVEELRGEIFGKLTWRISPTLQFESGLRFEASTISQSGDSDNEETFTYIKPRAQVTWTPWANNQFRARFEREVGQLDFGDFAASASLDDDNVLGGNADLQPEDRWIAEIAYERRFWGEGIISLAYRHDEIRNAIDVIPLEDGLSAVGNIGDGTLDQLSVNLVLPTERLGIPGGRLGFRNDWKHTEVTDPTTGRIRAVSGLRASQPVISFAQDLPTQKINWSVAWLPRLAQYTYGPDQTFGFDGTDYFEAQIEWKPVNGLSITAKVNVWDDFNIRRTAYADRTPARPVAFSEERLIDPEDFLSITVRKTF